MKKPQVKLCTVGYGPAFDPITKYTGRINMSISVSAAVRKNLPPLKCEE